MYYDDVVICYLILLLVENIGRLIFLCSVLDDFG